MYARTNYLEEIGLNDLAITASKISNHTNRLIKEFNKTPVKSNEQESIIVLQQYENSQDDFNFANEYSIEQENDQEYIEKQ